MKNKYYYSRKEVSEWLRENKLLNHNEIDEVLLKKPNCGESATNEKWIPKKYEHYYSVDYEGYVDVEVFLGSRSGRWDIEIGNCFKTREEAEKYRQKLINLGKEERR